MCKAAVLKLGSLDQGSSSTLNLSEMQILGPTPDPQRRSLGAPEVCADPASG